MNINSWSLILLLAFLLNTPILSAQEQPFPPGIYFSSESLQTKTPDFTLEEVRVKEGKSSKFRLFPEVDFWGQAKDTRENYLNSIYIEHITYLDSLNERRKLNISKVRAIAVESGVFFRIHATYSKKSAAAKRRALRKRKVNMFVRAHKLGQLCHITEEKVSSSSFIGGDNFKNSDKSNSSYSANQYIYSIPQGKLRRFDLESMEKALADDTKLLAHFKTNKDRKDQLFLYVLKYNERNKL